MKDMSRNEFFTAGLALYWAEGSKKTAGLRFCNSDPTLVIFMINWLKEFFNVETEDFAVHVGINQAHRGRDEEVKKYWSKITGIPISQFRKTSFKKTENVKIYENKAEHFGTLDVKVLKPGERYYKIMGQIKGLAEAGMKLAFQDVS